MTSGHGGAFPPGIPIGVVSSVSENAVRVAPMFRRHQLEYLRVADYGLQGILSDDRIRQSHPTNDAKTTDLSPDIPEGVGIVPASPISNEGTSPSNSAAGETQ